MVENLFNLDESNMTLRTRLFEHVLLMLLLAVAIFGAAIVLA